MRFLPAVEFQSYANESLKFLLIRKKQQFFREVFHPQSDYTSNCAKQKPETEFSGFLCKFYVVPRPTLRPSACHRGLASHCSRRFCFSCNWTCFPHAASCLPQIFKSQIFSFPHRSDYNNFTETGSRTAGRAFSGGKCLEGGGIHQPDFPSTAFTFHRSANLNVCEQWVAKWSYFSRADGWWSWRFLRVPLNTLLCLESRWRGLCLSWKRAGVSSLPWLAAPLSIIGKENSGAEPCEPSWPRR